MDGIMVERRRNGWYHGRTEKEWMVSWYDGEGMVDRTEKEWLVGRRRNGW